LRGVPACSEVRKRNEPGRAGRDQRTGEFTREVKAGVQIDRAHLFPGLSADGKSVIGLAPRRRSAVDEVRHPSNGGSRVGQQPIAGGAICEIADPGHGKVRPGRGFGSSSDRIRIHVGKHRSHALADQGLGDGAADAVARAGDQSGIARRVEQSLQQTHLCWISPGVPRC
jgi:hypothetical protein